MACKTETKTIGEQEYSVTQWSATEALLMKFKLGKVFGTAISTLTANYRELEKEGNEEILVKGISSIFESNEPEEILAIIKKSIIGVAVDGKKITDSYFEELFSGDNLMSVYKVFIFVMKVNYGNLLKGQWADNLLTKIQK